MGLLTLAFIDDNPREARWLSDREKAFVVADLEADERRAGPRNHGFGEAMKAPGVWLLIGICFCLASANPTLGFWGPTIISGLGVGSNTVVGLLSAIPYLI